MTDWHAATWPGARLGEAMAALARRAGLQPEGDARRHAPVGGGERALAAWLDATAEAMRLEAEPVETTYDDLEDLLRAGAPALLRLPGDGPPRFLALVEAGRRRVALLAPDGMMHRVRTAELCRAVRAPLEAPAASAVDRMLDEVGVPRERRARARRALLRERLASRRIGRCWLLRDAPGAPFRRQLLRAGSGRTLLLMMAAHGAYYGLWLLSWYLVGQAALSGRRPDDGWLLAWLLVLLSAVPLRAMVVHAQGAMGATVGALLKRRILHGALRLRPDEIRREGAGRLLGRVLESEAVESLALNGGLSALLGILELGMALLVLGAGAGGPLHAATLAGWVGVTVALALRYRRRHRLWTDARQEMTNDLVERMVGYRTRLAQREPARWHVEEDAQLERYVARSRALDRTNARIQAVVPRGWMILGLAALAPAFAVGAPAPGALAVAVGGVLLGYRSLGRLAPALVQLPAASVAWRQVAPFFRAAARTPTVGVPAARATAVRDRTRSRTESETASAQDALDASRPTGSERSSAPLLDAQALRFGYAGRDAPVIADLDLRVRRGDRIVIGGPSGSGKSTLVSLLVGLRSPDAGLLLLGGLDRATLGAASWRRHIAGVPQFHENHVLTGPLAFNLLMGRAWPPGPEDLAEAETVCRELGLGHLLDRMPSGLMQMVGDTGWRLSHGERSRIFLARALLQGADVVVLDESFAALDPETLGRTLRCVDARAKTVVAIAHS